MKSSLIIIGAFVIGCALGRLGLVPSGIAGSDLSTWILYALMLQVGIGIGSDPKIKDIFRNIRPSLLLLPVATIVGSIVASFLISFAISRWSSTEVMAVGCGFGYYSLSSILITSLKEASIGAQAAAELGTIALIANIFREMMTLLLAPVMVRVFGPVAPIAAGGATTADVTLPIITKSSGKDWVIASIIHGVLVDFSVPLIVPFFCSL
ncbi:MAG: lysine exporter LysO family protein [Candidatus Cryptobacteroides sp.]